MLTKIALIFKIILRWLIMYIDFKLLGKRISQRRRELGIKQNELAEKAEIANNYLSNIETGRSIPSLETFSRLCIVLNATPDSFLLGTVKTDDVTQSIIDNLKLCDNNSIDLVDDFVQMIVKRQNHTEHKKKQVKK